VRVKYLLPCSCGKKVAIESSQAGQDILCSCGKTMEAPTMQGIRRLEQQVEKEHEPKATSSFGGAAIGIALAGLVILGAGGALTYRVYTTRPVLPSVDYATPWDTWHMWHNLREGVQLPEYMDSPYLQQKKVYNQYMTVGVVIMALGIITIACAAIAAYFNRRSRRPTAQRTE
jgi:hypothetical protein